jgi:hypothetical protein
VLPAIPEQQAVIQPKRGAPTPSEDSAPPAPKRPPPPCPMSEEDRQEKVQAELRRQKDEKQRAERTLADFQAKLRAGTLGQASQAKGSGGAAQGSGGATQRSEEQAQRTEAAKKAEAARRAEEFEKQKRELEELEQTFKRKKELSKRKKNDKGETLLSYEEGFMWCEKCQYVSDIAPQSDLNQRWKLKGCQRPSCPGSFQWKNHYQRPYFDEDFVYEGYKVVKPCLLYENGTSCPEGN